MKDKIEGLYKYITIQIKWQFDLTEGISKLCI